MTAGRKAMNGQELARIPKPAAFCQTLIAIRARLSLRSTMPGDRT